MLDRLVTAIKSRGNRIRIIVHSTGYVDEYVIEDMDGSIIMPEDFPSEWNGKVFQLVEGHTEEWEK